MKKKISVLGFVLIIIGFGIYYLIGPERINSILDQQAPVINIDELPSFYRLGTDFDYSIIKCEDNIDKTCTVERSSDFNINLEGLQTITLTAIDNAGNKAVYSYTIEIVESFDGSMFIPKGYYDSIEGLQGEELKSKLNDIITGHIEFPYTDDETDVWDILKEADEDPDNPNNVILFYTGLSWYKDCQDTTYPPDFCEMEIESEVEIIEWNREHIWSKSRGDFEIKEGTTSVLDMGAHTDLHHLVAAERTMNSIKNNRMFEDCNSETDQNVTDVGYGNYTCNEWSFEPRDEVKGDVARMLFYMAVRYEGEEGDMVDLELTNDLIVDKSSKLPFYGYLEDLLKWHIQDPVSEKEVLRNQVIYSYQRNRNPFIDRPELVELIWGSSN
ncbi:MAG: endonuclease [Candidatus Izemoplasmatales bacterium]|nr:endonuclease [Candidatus Izemoplasmatales bacterium]